MESTHHKANISVQKDPSDASDERQQQALRERGKLPAHVACIMDGNGRCAQRPFPSMIQATWAGSSPRS